MIDDVNIYKCYISDCDDMIDKEYRDKIIIKNEIYGKEEDMDIKDGNND